MLAQDHGGRIVGASSIVAKRGVPTHSGHPEFFHATNTLKCFEDGLTIKEKQDLCDLRAGHIVKEEVLPWAC